MIDSSPSSTPDLSRRSLVKTAATAAAVGGTLVLGLPGGAEAAARPAARRAQAADAPEHRESGDGVLVRVVDERLGILEVYTGTGHRTITDRDLAVRLARLAR